MKQEKQDNRYRPSEDDRRVQQALGRIRGLVGADEFKAWVERLEQIRPALLPWRTEKHFPVSHLLFAIDPGNGLTTAMQSLHAYLAASGLFHGDADGFTPLRLEELRMAYSEHLTHNQKEAYAMIKSSIEDDDPGLYSLDLTDWMDKFDNLWFQRLLDLCVHLAPANRYVFVVPMLEDPELERIRKRLADRLPIELVRFPQPDPPLLFSLLRSRMKAFGLSLPDAYAPMLHRWVLRLKSNGRFHGMRSLDNLADELALAHARAHPDRLPEKQKAELDRHVAEALLIPPSSQPAMSAQERLSSLRGIGTQRKQILELAQAARMEKELAMSGAQARPPCLHMLFTGNPGTGKTEVARIVGQLFREQGLLANGELLEVNRFDLVGQYVGQTGPKTLSVCRSAYGSILFIDEAYLLSIGADSPMSRDFGREAIGALIAEMENNRDRLIVILAGYKDEMDRFLRANPGLSARIPHRIHFPSHDRKTLSEIFLSMMEQAGETTDGFRDQAAEWFMQLPQERLDSPHFGNARFARNLSERVQLKALLRLAAQQGDHVGTTERLVFQASDFQLAVGDPDMLRTEATEKRPIGFHAGAR